MEGTGAVDRIEISGEEGLKMEKKGILVVSFGYGRPGIYKSDDLEQTGTDRT